MSEAGGSGCFVYPDFQRTPDAINLHVGSMAVVVAGELSHIALNAVELGVDNITLRVFLGYDVRYWAILSQGATP